MSIGMQILFFRELNFWGANVHPNAGIDAKVALNFHKLRNSHPELFFSTRLNKFWYFLYGCLAIWDRLESPLNGRVSLKVAKARVALHH